MIFESIAWQTKHSLAFAMPGLDIRTSGGQIVVHPSERPEGQYQWKDWNPLDGTRPHIAEAPAWVVGFACGTLEAKPKKSAPKAAIRQGGTLCSLEADEEAPVYLCLNGAAPLGGVVVSVKALDLGGEALACYASLPAPAFKLSD